MSIEQEKLNALNQALGKIEKEFGKGSVMKLGEATSMAVSYTHLDVYKRQDVGSVLIGKEAVECGLINEVGGLKDAMNKLKELIKESNNK